MIFTVLLIVSCHFIISLAFLFLGSGQLKMQLVRNLYRQKNEMETLVIDAMLSN